MSNSMDKNDIQYVDEKPDSVYAPKQHQVVQIDNVQVLGLDPADAEFYMNFSDERRKKVIHKVRLPRSLGLNIEYDAVLNIADIAKVDIRLVPMLAVLYLISHIDRANIGVSAPDLRGNLC